MPDRHDDGTSDERDPTAGELISDDPAENRRQVDERARVPPEQLGVQHDHERGAVRRIGQVADVPELGVVGPERQVGVERDHRADVRGHLARADVDPLPEPT